jgi:hypothetical protein
MNPNNAVKHAVAGILLAGGMASFGASWSPASIPISYSAQNFPGATFGAMSGFQVPGFHVSNNPALLGATLTGVTYDLQFRNYADLTVVNTGQTSLTVTQLSIDAALRTTLPGTAVNFQNDNDWTDPNADPDLLTSFVLPNQNDFYTTSFDENDTANGSSLLLSLANRNLLHAAVTVSGNVAWPIQGRSSVVTASGGSSLDTSITPLGDYSLVVTYFYDPPSGEVPEASTWMAMAPLAALGVWQVRRRMRTAPAAKA